VGLGLAHRGSGGSGVPQKNKVISSLRLRSGARACPHEESGGSGLPPKHKETS